MILTMNVIVFVFCQMGCRKPSNFDDVATQTKFDFDAIKRRINLIVAAFLSKILIGSSRLDFEVDITYYGALILFARTYKVYMC